MEWLTNGIPPWEAYRSFMLGRLIALDKHPDVQPVGIGGTWRRLFPNIVLKVTGPEATMACQDGQLCARFNAGIGGVFRGVQAIWDENSTAEDCVFLLVDAKNVFNKINRDVTMWTFRHLWPSGARFAFNFYCHWSLLVFWNGNGAASFLHSKEGVTQGYPLAMISYRIGIVPLINNLKQEIPDFTQPWHDDVAGASGLFMIIVTYFYSLTHQGLGHGYYPTPSKSVLIVHLENIEAVKEFGSHHRFKVFTGAHYIGGCIEDNESKSDWLRECTLVWEKKINTISKPRVNIPRRVTL